jgi:hypothetical protein
MGDQNLLSRAPPCFGRHVTPLVPAAFAVVSIHSSFKIVNIIAESLSQHDEKHVVPTPLSGIKVGRRRRNNYTVSIYAVEVEARGIPAKSLYNLLKDLGLPRGAISSALEWVLKVALLDFYRIWLGREGNVSSGPPLRSSPLNAH